MANQKITLVQTIGNLENFYEFREGKALPLLLKLHREEINGLRMKSHSFSPNSMNPSYLYRPETRADNPEEEYYSLSENSLETLIKKWKIYIPKFIDIHAKRKYIDYILVTYHSATTQSDVVNPLCTDYRHRILFRDKKRVLEKFGSNYDFVRGQFNSNPNAVLLSELVQETLGNKRVAERNRNKVKMLLSK